MPRSHVRKTLLALAAAAAVALLAPVFPGASIRVATGSVEIGRGEPPIWKAAGSGDELGAGDRIRTGADGRAEIAQGGATLRLYPNSMLHLPSAAPAAAVELDHGSSLFDVLHTDEGYQVHTPEVVVSVKGTRFLVVVVDASHAASVSVYRGLVGVRGEDGSHSDETLVHPGFSAFGSDHFELSWHGSDDPWESWSAGGPAPEPFGAHDRHEAALRDARAAALTMSEGLPKLPERGEDRVKPPIAALPDVPAKAEPVGDVTRDAVTDATQDVDKTEDLIDDVVRDTTGGMLSLVFVDGSGGQGSDHVNVVGPNNTVWSFDQGDVRDILKGEETLPPELTALLQSQGTTDTALAQQMMSLLRN